MYSFVSYSSGVGGIILDYSTAELNQSGSMVKTSHDSFPCIILGHGVCEMCVV